MVERTAEDYAKILRSINLENETNPLCINIEDMLARLDEFETLLTNVKAETNGIMENHVSGILAFQENFQTMRTRIDNLEHLIDKVHTNMLAVESSMDIAEEELNVTDYSLKGLLRKPLFAKSKTGSTEETGADKQVRTNLRDGEFQAVPIFKSNDYFGDYFANCNEDVAKEPLTREELGRV